MLNFGNSKYKRKRVILGYKEEIEEYNYLKVNVDSSNIKGTIHRFQQFDSWKPYNTQVVF